MTELEYADKRVHNAKWLCYINGIEIPIMGATFNTKLSGMSMVEVYLIPHRTITRLGAGDRLPLTLFYLDEHWDPDNPEFRLAFDGEIHGWGHSNTGTTRTISFQAYGHIYILEQLYLFYMASVNDIGKALTGDKFDPTTITQPMVIYPYSLFHQGLIFDGTESEQFIRSPYGFIKNILRALVGKVTPEGTDKSIPFKYASIPGRNFFTRWTLKNFFHKRWAALPVLDEIDEDGCFPLIRAIKEVEILKALQTGIVSQNVGAAGSVRQMLQWLLDRMLYEVSIIPASPASMVNLENGQIQGKHNLTNMWVKSKQGQIFKGLKKPSLVNYIIKPKSFFGIPPTCNVIFPCMQNISTYQENYLGQPTRVLLQEQLLSQVLKGEQPSINDVIKNTLITGYPPEVGAFQRRAVNSKIPETGKNFLLWPEEFYKGPIMHRISGPSWLTTLQQFHKEMLKTDVATAEETRTGVLEALAKKYAAKNNLPLYLVFAIIHRESGWGKNLESFKGALGVMQVMPIARKEVANEVFNEPEPSDNDLKNDPETGIRYGCAYLARLRDNYGIDVNSDTFLAAYNEGPSARFKKPEAWTADAKRYVRNVNKLKLMYGGIAEETGPMGKIFEYYAQYEYFKERYNKRIGGKSCRWNPYLIVGFPTMLFDRRTDGVDTVGYIIEITSDWWAGDASPRMDTKIQYMYGRTFQEFINDIIIHRNNFEETLDSAPGEFIPEIKSTLQVQKEADGFYNGLLYNREINTLLDRETAFNWKKVLRYLDNKGNQQVIDTEKLEKFDYDIEPAKEYDSLFNHFDSAMNYVSRPICTLDEYIEIYHEKPLEKLLGDEVTGENFLYSGKKKQSRFYNRIYNTTQGPKEGEIFSGLTNIGDPPHYINVSRQKYLEKNEIPDVSTNWNDLLLAYRDFVLNRITPAE